VEAALVRERQVHALGLCVEFRPALAGLTDGGRVDDGSDVLDVAGQETIEEVDVCVSQVCEVLVLVNGILLVGEELQASLFLCLEALDRRRDQTVCAEVLADLDGVCRVIIGATGIESEQASMASIHVKISFWQVTYDCLEETAGGLLWVMLAPGAWAIDAEEDILVEEEEEEEVEEEVESVARVEKVEGGEEYLSRRQSTREDM
jgi:hypothetical protein